MEEVTKSKTFKVIAITIGAIILLLVVFAAGIFVGLKKARFSYSWGENYERNFVGPRMGGPMGGPMGVFQDMEGRGFRNGHGTSGTIISVTDNNIVIKDRNNNENTVTVTDKTIIKNGSNEIKISDLKPDQGIVVLGTPGNNGVINADLIRVFDNSVNSNNASGNNSTNSQNNNSNSNNSPN